MKAQREAERKRGKLHLVRSRPHQYWPLLSSSAPGVHRGDHRHLPRLAGVIQQVLRVAVRTPHAGETILEKPAVQVPPHLPVDEAAPEAKPPLEALLPLPPHLLEQRIEKAVQGCRARVPRPVKASRLCGQDDAPCLPQRGRTSEHALILLEGQGGIPGQAPKVALQSQGKPPGRAYEPGEELYQEDPRHECDA